MIYSFGLLPVRKGAWKRGKIEVGRKGKQTFSPPRYVFRTACTPSSSKPCTLPNQHALSALASFPVAPKMEPHTRYRFHQAGRDNPQMVSWASLTTVLAGITLSLDGGKQGKARGV